MSQLLLFSSRNLNLNSGKQETQKQTSHITPCKSFFFSVLCILGLLTPDLYSQTSLPRQQETKHECGSTQLLKNNLALDPGLAARLSSMKSAGNGDNSGAKSPPSSTYLIPIVFHIITDPQNPTAIPSYERIQMQLASLNAAFSNSLNALNHVAVGPRSTNTMIQFCFAKKGWFNNAQVAWPTSSVGVVYYSIAGSTNSLVTNVNINNNACFTALTSLSGAQYPASKYLNVWCVPNICTTNNTSVNAPPSVIGIGTFPWMTLPIDGIVMRNDCIGNNTYGNFTGAMFPPLDKGNVLAHEAGHYLGLFHTFETITNANLATGGGAVGCYGLTSPTTDGDLVFDTPPTMINGPIIPGNYNTCNENYAPYGPGPGPDVNDQLENFMSYSDDDYMNTFSFKQGERMWGALDNTFPSTFLTAQRANLISSTNLSNTGVSLAPSCGPGLLTSKFKWSLGALTCSLATVQFYQPALPGYLSASTHTWYFGDGGTSNAINPSHTYNIAPYNFTATLVTSNGSGTSTSTLQVIIPTGLPQIANWSGKNNPVCRGTQQTILVRFPPGVPTALISDGTTSYVVTSNFNLTGGFYDFPFTFTVNSTGTWSIMLGSCNTVTTVASFTVVDCCPNMVYNGDLELGNVGFTSDYTLTTNNFSGGNAAINFSWSMFAPEWFQTGKEFMIDSYGLYGGCGNPLVRKLLLGQTITGLQPNTSYYVSFKSNQSIDSIGYPCTNKLNLRLFCSAAPQLLNVNVLPANVVPTSLGGVSGIGSQQVHSFMVTTPPSINASTTFSYELYEVDNRSGLGFDYSLDNFIVARMNGPLALTPLTSTISACQVSTVQLNAQGTCSNISNYTLVWQPSAGLSCSNCPNPVVTAAATTVYTLIAIPPITVPPTPNIVLTSTVYATAGPTMSISMATLNPCFPPSYSLTIGSAVNATWQPGNALGTSVIVSPTVATVYSVTASSIFNQQPCLTNTVISVTVPSVSLISATAQRTLICKGDAVSLNGQGAASYTWSTSQTIAVISVTPQQNTTYTLQGKDANGCPTKTASVKVNVSPCFNIGESQIEHGSLLAYPNPNSGQFRLEATTEIAASLFNALGELIGIFKLETANHYTEEISDLPAGIYFITCEVNNNSYTQKVIVLR